MKEFAKETKDGLRTRKVPADDNLIQTKLLNHNYLPVVYDPVPLHDPDTQTVVLSGYTVMADRVVRHYVVTSRTAEEINRIAANKKKQADIEAGLPSWAEVETAIKSAFSTSDQQAIILKMARVLYWLAKNQID